MAHVGQFVKACTGCMQGGLTDLWLDDPYVVAASKLVKMADAENAAGNVFPVSLEQMIPILILFALRHASFALRCSSGDSSRKVGIGSRLKVPCPMEIQEILL